MSQSGFLLATLLAAFVLYLAAKNRLGTYAGVFFGPTAPLPTLPSASTAPVSMPVPGVNPNVTGILDNAAPGFLSGLP